MKQIGLLIITLGTVFAFSFGATGVIYATTDSDLQAACAQANYEPSYCATVDKDKNPIAGPDGIINTIANFIAYIAGAVAVIMVIYGGFRYVISNGDPAKITSARQIITYALIGIVVIILARAIILFVLSQLL